MAAPSLRRQARIAAYVDRLYALYGPDRSKWPPFSEWPPPPVWLRVVS